MLLPLGITTFTFLAGSEELLLLVIVNVAFAPAIKFKLDGLTFITAPVVEPRVIFKLLAALG